MIISILIGVFIMFLYAWSGMEGKNFFKENARKFGIPVVASLYCWNPLGLLLIAPLALGYGIPDPTDEGSTLGRFWYEVFEGDHFLANFATRLTTGGVLGLILFAVTFHWWTTLFAVWYVFWTVYSKADDRLIWKFNLEELLIGAGLGAAIIL